MGGSGSKGCTIKLNGKYLTLSGAADIGNSTYHERPLYYNKNDTDRGWLSDKLDKSHWDWMNYFPVVVTCLDDIKIDPGIDIDYKLIPAFGIDPYYFEHGKMYYFLYFRVPNCDEAYFPVYFNKYDGSKYTWTGGTNNKPLINNKGDPVKKYGDKVITFDNCEDCSHETWVWTDEDNLCTMPCTVGSGPCKYRPHKYGSTIQCTNPGPKVPGSDHGCPASMYYCGSISEFFTKV